VNGQVRVSGFSDFHHLRGRLFWLLLFVSMGCLSGGCASVRITDPVATATQQFLLTQAIEDAVDQLDTNVVRDRTVFVKSTYLDIPEKQFLIASVRARLLHMGVRLTDTREQASLVVELRSEAVGIDRAENLIGLPAMFLPAGPSIGGMEINTLILPEIAFYKKIDQRGYASVAFVAYWQDTGDLAGASGPTYGFTTRQDVWIMGVGPTSTGNIIPVQPDPITDD